MILDDIDDLMLEIQQLQKSGQISDKSAKGVYELIRDALKPEQTVGEMAIEGPEDAIKQEKGSDTLLTPQAETAENSRSQDLYNNHVSETVGDNT